MIVVSNTSPLTNLAAIGQFNLLQKLFGEIYIAAGVWTELNAFGQMWPGSQDTAAAPWIIQHSVQNQQLVLALRRDLDRGEAESIALGMELNADVILLDEKDGRSAAKRMGLQPMGVLGILLSAKRNGYISVVKPHMDTLRQQAGFYLSQPLYDEVLKIAKEK